MKQTVEMEKWLAKRREILQNTKPEYRPRTKERPLKSRSAENGVHWRRPANMRGTMLLKAAK